MMKRFFIILNILCLCLHIKAQTNDMLQNFLIRYGYRDATSCEEAIEPLIELRSASPCNNIALRGKNYAPFFVPSENDPIMTVRLNLIFIQKDDGTGNFQANNEEQQDLLDEAIADLNRIVSSFVLPGPDCFTGTNEEMIHDTRIRFVDHRFYVRNSSVWNNNLHTEDMSKLCVSSNNWYLNAIDDSINATINDSLKGINIYFTEDSIIYHHFWELQNTNDTLSNLWTGYSENACSRFPSYSDWQKSSRIHMPCLFSKFWWMKNIVPQMGEHGYPSWEDQCRYWFINTISLGLVHELGHSFYLLHQNNETLSNSFYPTSNCYNTIMNPGGGTPRNFLPPNEIGRMYFNSMTTNLQQYIPSSTYLGVRILDTNVSLPQMRCFYSLLINSSGNVTIPCDIVFSKQGFIKVLSGGVLTVDGANLHSCGNSNSWGGINVLSGGKLVLSDTEINDYNIVVKSGGSLIVDNDLTITGDHSIRVESGGIICVTNNATIDLVDEFSTIEIDKNAILGCIACNETCITSRSGLSNSGNGHFVTYEGNDYIQNVTITSDYIATGDSVYAGYDVTTTKPVGNVVVETGGNLRIKANETTLTKNVEIKLGGTLEIGK